MSPSVNTRILDHVVHLTPPGTLEESVKAFRDLGFTVVPGGTHAGGETANALVVFADGTYLELLHFTHAPALTAPADATTAATATAISSSTHPWAQKQPGWIDYAFLGNAGSPSVADTINARARAPGAAAARYAAEVRGGRRREDGRVLEWLISAPRRPEDEDGGRDGGGRGDVRGRLPFFCGDLTPRIWRVPLEPRSNADHANTAKGIAHVRLLAAAEDLDGHAAQLTQVLGVPPASSTTGSTSARVVWELGRQPTHEREGFGGAPVLILSEPEDEEEREYLRVRGAGIYELGVVVGDAGREGVARTPYGRVVWKAADAAAGTGR
ncbi:glyoxalase-like domain-containing protein [Trametes meyenii]|nr:glyoxalase-like domain-containing protein [Trametes meyenii]